MELLKVKSASTAVLLTLMTATVRTMPAAPPNEYALKSVFLYNFCQFIEWPESAFSSPGEPLIIGIVGEDPFDALLREAVKGETYHNRPIQIEHYHGPKDIKHCHLLFIGRSETSHLDAILEVVDSQSIVTVGETDDFLDRGGMISLPAERNRIRLRIRPSAFHAVNLSVSSKLLRVADVKY